MNQKNKLYAGATLGLAAAATLGFGAARLTQPVPAVPQTESKPAVPGDSVTMSAQDIGQAQIAVAPAMAGALDAALMASATVEAMPDAQAVLTAHAPGTITRILKRLGDPVRVGEVLLLVESRDASQIAGDQAAAAARVALARQQAVREQGLVEQGVSARADYETAQANLAVAQADARRAAGAAGAVRLARDGRSVAVVSPISGRITALPANLGQFVPPESELARVADPRRIQITASLPVSDAARVRVGDRVELATGDGGKVEGRVRSSTGVVNVGTRSATVVIEPSGGAFVPGQMAQVRIFASGLANGGGVNIGVIVPQDAVQTLGDRSVVFVRTANGFKARTVQVGSRGEGLVSIASGLSAGTKIATSNAFLLKAEIEKNEGGDE
ncbi:MAG: efflux RND transporter periplasmic adaptor subunit [Sphingomonadales bacterium]|nr:efflux RND transporter periplasmic adaptor subunit [Sphingomonadales bacterium]MDE2171015.1 efflux RND transporter periplasmic adaptor subunit [Sphingomonadales bacterium]